MRRFQKGTATITAVIFTMISLLLTIAYLRYSLSASVVEKYRFAESSALLLAETGINKVGMPQLPYLYDQVIVFATQKVKFSEGPEFDGFYHDVVCSSYVDDYGKTYFYASAWGTAEFQNTEGKLVKIERKAEVNLIAEDFSKFMYFTNSEEPGGGPYTSGTVTFGASDTLEGIVHTNGEITMSAYGCPKFKGQVNASLGINMGNCEETSFANATYDDSADVISYPPTNTVERVKNSADYVFTADELLWRGAIKDSLIMTEIEFVTGGFKVAQWAYAIPPVTEDGQPTLSYTWDEDNTIGGLDDGKIGVDLPFSILTGYASVDSVFLSDYDSDGDGVDDVLNGYSIGDTIVISSVDTSYKYWISVITGKSTSGGDYIFKVDYQEQGGFFTGGFVDGESVQLSHRTGMISEQFNHFAFYHNHADDGTSVCQSTGFHHFDFEPPNGTDYIMNWTTFHKDRAVIYVKDGQVRVHGEVDGQFTIVTDNYTEYRRQDDPTIIDRVWDNIWLIDDIIYTDSNQNTGEVVYGTPNRLGLVSGGNVIIANTSDNGAKNRASGADIIINAGIIAMHDSFVAHYWQNSVPGAAENGFNPITEEPYYATSPATSKADGRGTFRNPTSTTQQTTSNDLRGTVKLYGSITQNLRGFMKRNPPGSYANYWIGYDKSYHYDFNFSDFFPPPNFPNTTGEDGGMKLILKSYSEVPTRSGKSGL